MNKRQNKENSTPGNNDKSLKTVALMWHYLEVNAVYAILMLNYCN